MPKANSAEKKGWGGDSSEDEDIEINSSNEGSDDTMSSDDEKKKRRRNLTEESDSDPDDPKPRRKSSKKHQLPQNITLLSDQEIKNKFKYKKHTCALSHLPAKNKACIHIIKTCKYFQILA